MSSDRKWQCYAPNFREEVNSKSHSPKEVALSRQLIFLLTSTVTPATICQLQTLRANHSSSQMRCGRP